MVDRKEYMKAYHKKWYNEVVKPRRKAFFFNKKCEKCGSSDELELHHVDPSTKLSHNIWSWSEESRNKEVEKCIVLCRSCHQKYHKEKNIKHGIKRYQKGCRCDVCRKAKSISNAKRIRKKAG